MKKLFFIVFTFLSVLNASFDIQVNEDKAKKIFDKNQLNCIEEVAKKYQKIVTSDDILICPGRSCVYYTYAFEKILSHNQNKETSSIFKIPFSRGHFLLSETADECRRYFQDRIDLINKETESRNLSIGNNNISSSQIWRTVQYGENYMDKVFLAREKKFIPSYDYRVSDNEISFYLDFLRKNGVTCEKLKNCKGKIILTDTLSTGAGLKGFIFILKKLVGQDFILENKLKIINVSYKKFKDENNYFFEIPIDNIEISEDMFSFFSYNDPLDLKNMFFFPPNAWHESMCNQGLHSDADSAAQEIDQFLDAT